MPNSNCMPSLIFVSYTSLSQEGFPINGVEDNRDNHYAFINAKIFVDYKTVIENGTLIIKNGRIISVGKEADIPVQIAGRPVVGYRQQPSRKGGGRLIWPLNSTPGAPARV